jgi:hypothetical protein
VTYDKMVEIQKRPAIPFPAHRRYI